MHRQPRRTSQPPPQGAFDTDVDLHGGDKLYDEDKASRVVGGDHDEEVRRTEDVHVV